MVGCMAGTSLAMAPGMVVGQMAQYVDLDGLCCTRGTESTGSSTTRSHELTVQQPLGLTRSRRRCSEKSVIARSGCCAETAPRRVRALSASL